MTTCLVTGGAGFLGSHLVKHLLEHTDWNIKVWDSFTYAAMGGERLKGLAKNSRFDLTVIDVNHADYQELDPSIKYIAHLAAETHVTRSIEKARPFLYSNIFGTYSMLEFARQLPNLKKFLYFSTDEVFGSSDLTEEYFGEWSRYRSGNPYAATKAAGEELALAWCNTFGVPVVISHCSNLFGEGQHPEKFIPRIIYEISRDREVVIHAKPNGEPGRRMYVYVGDVAAAIKLLLEQAEIHCKYNIPGVTFSNLEIAEKISGMIGKKLKYSLAYPHKERPGWDFSYNISGDAIKEYGWERGDFDTQLQQTIQSEFVCRG